MRRFVLPNMSLVTERSLRDLFARVRSTLGEKGERDGNSIVSSVLAAFRQFFLNLGKPHYAHVDIRPDDPLLPAPFKDRLDAIAADLSMGNDEAISLRDALIAAHNFTTVRASELKRRSEELAGMTADLRLVSGQLGEEVLVFSDNFVDESKLDPSFPTEYLQAQVMPGQGSLTLNRIGVQITAPDDVQIEVNPLDGLSREPTPSNVGRFYEGHFYDFLGKASPEGGSFHLQEKVDNNTLSGFTQSSFQVPVPPQKGATRTEKKAFKKALRDFVVPGGQEEAFLERVKSGVFNDKFVGKNAQKKFDKWLETQRLKTHKKDKVARKEYMYYAQNPDKAEQAGIDLTPDPPVTAENLVIVDVGASAEELQTSRQSMLDQNPASYWQAELVRETNIIQDKVNQLLADNANAQVQPEQLRQLASSSAVDREDFGLEIIFTYATSRTLNWITLNPMVFDDGAFLEVTDVSTSADMESPFEQVESFAGQKYSNILTDEANKEIAGDVATALLEPSRSSFKGQGIWPFASRQVQKVRIRLVQRTPVPNPFERIVIDAQRVYSSRIK